jgi:hypothetical protein
VLSLGGVTPPVFHPVALVLILMTAALLWLRIIGALKKNS